jgi:hypothetical protein
MQNRNSAIYLNKDYKKSIKEGNITIPYSEADQKFIEKKNDFEQYYIIAVMSLRIRDEVLDALLYAELNENNPTIKFWNNPFVSFIRAPDCQDNESKLYVKNWKSHLPILSDATKYLTADEKYLIRQVPIWYNHILKYLKNNLHKLSSHDKRLVNNKLNDYINEIRSAMNDADDAKEEVENLVDEDEDDEDEEF